MQIILRTEARTHTHAAFRALMPMSGRLPVPAKSCPRHGTLERVVNIEAEGGTVVLRLTSDEAERLAVAIWADHETLSRAEYYVRYGLSRPDVRALADAIAEAANGGDQGAPSARGAACACGLRPFTAAPALGCLS